MSHRWLVLLLPLALAAGVQAQNSVLTCATSAVPTNVRAEGISERTGDILLSCSGGQPAGQISGNIIVSLNVNVTNRILGEWDHGRFPDREQRVGEHYLHRDAIPNRRCRVQWRGVQCLTSRHGRPSHCEFARQCKPTWLRE